jgi:DNA-binding MarR family transcriptional regulator
MMTHTNPAHPIEGAPSPSNDEATLVDLLAAYQYLQSQNNRLAARLSHELGVGPADLRALLYLYDTTDATPKDVATRVEQTTGSVTALLDRLERSGHIVRGPHPGDRRKLTLQLTNSGRRIVDAVKAPYQTAFAGVVSGTDTDRTVEILRALAAALESAIKTLTTGANALDPANQ